MMKNKGWGMLLIAFVLLMAACGNLGNNGQAADTLESKSASQPPAYKELYRTSVFLGDSITEGLSYHDVLDAYNVLADAGKTAEFTLMTDDVDQLVARNPERVFIHLGSTDILWPTDNPKEYSLTHYERLIGAIQDRLPETTITLLSVIPVTADAEKVEPRYGNIAEYNEELQALAEKKQVHYIDLASLVANHTEWYDTDGIHFQAVFYPILLDYINEHSK